MNIFFSLKMFTTGMLMGLLIDFVLPFMDFFFFESGTLALPARVKSKKISLFHQSLPLKNSGLLPWDCGPGWRCTNQIPGLEGAVAPMSHI